MTLQTKTRSRVIEEEYQELIGHCDCRANNKPCLNTIAAADDGNGLLVFTATSHLGDTIMVEMMRSNALAFAKDLLSMIRVMSTPIVPTLTEDAGQ